MPTSQSNPIAILAQQCLAHLDREEAYLRDLRDSLLELNLALRRGSLDQMESARSKQAHNAERGLALSPLRNDLVARIAAAFQLRSEEITLSRLVVQLPRPWSDQITAYQHRMRELSAEIHFLNRRNASLVQFCRTYMKQILTDASGGFPVTRYGPGGTQLEGTCGSLLLAQG